MVRSIKLKSVVSFLGLGLAPKDHIKKFSINFKKSIEFKKKLRILFSKIITKSN